MHLVVGGQAHLGRRRLRPRALGQLHRTEGDALQLSEWQSSGPFDSVRLEVHLDAQHAPVGEHDDALLAQLKVIHVEEDPHAAPPAVQARVDLSSHTL